MSKTSQIEIQLNKSVISVGSLIESMLNSGFSANVDGKMMLLPLDDIDDFSWEVKEFNLEVLKNIIEVKLSNDEFIGLTLLFGNTHSGGEFLLKRDSIYLSISINPIYTDEDSNLLNWQFYLTEILKIMKNSKNGYTNIQNIRCETIF